MWNEKPSMLLEIKALTLGVTERLSELLFAPLHQLEQHPPVSGRTEPLRLLGPAFGTSQTAPAELLEFLQQTTVLPILQEEMPVTNLSGRDR